MKMRRALVLLNITANSFSAMKKWSIFQPIFMRQYSGMVEVYEYEPPCDLSQIIKHSVENGVNDIIAAGGDGTIHHIANLLINMGYADTVSLGGIGLGSSNDFYKCLESPLSRYPIRCSNNTKCKSDVGKCVFIDDNGRKQERYFLVNGSIGISAYGNWIFNNDLFPIQLLKRYWLNGAIFYSILKAILSFQKTYIEVQFRFEKKEQIFSNINILKKPFVSGEFFFRDDVKPDDGFFAIKLVGNLSRLKLVRKIMSLKKGEFVLSDQCHSRREKSISLESKDPFYLELDGESFRASRAEFTLIPQFLNLLGRSYDVD